MFSKLLKDNRKKAIKILREEGKKNKQKNTKKTKKVKI